VRLNDICVSRGFSVAVRMLCNGASPLKCDLGCNDSCDVDLDRLVETARGWDSDDWDYNRSEQYSPKMFETKAPFPA
jgi:hypothetical protein